MHPHDFQDDRQSQPGSISSRAFAAPETIEDARPVIHRDAWPAVQNTQRTLLIDLDDHLAPGCGMRERVFDQVAQRIRNRCGVTHDDDRVVGTARELLAGLSPSERAHVFGGTAAEVYGLAERSAALND